MRAHETLETLIKIGLVIKDAADEQDVKAFLSAGGMTRVMDLVGHVVDELSEDDLDRAVARLVKKQKALLGDTSLLKLPTGKLIQYLQLGDARVALSAKRVKVAMDRDFLTWVVDDVLPVLCAVAPVVLPLVL